MELHLRRRVFVLLCLFFVHCGRCTDSADNCIISEERSKAKQYNVTDIQSRRKEFMHKKGGNGTGTKVKDFVDALTQNISTCKVHQRRYTRRIFKTLSKERINLLYNELPKYLYNQEKLERETRELVLEIGFGHGEHFIHLAKVKPEALLFGIETFLNGVANTLKLAVNQNVTNILMYPNDLNYIFNDLPNSIFNTIYILFPDPWVSEGKKRKRRMVNDDFIKVLQTKLKDRGRFVFATDIDEYFDEVFQFIATNNNFQITNTNDYIQQPDNYLETKYHEKAIAEGRRAQFLICRIVK